MVTRYFEMENAEKFVEWDTNHECKHKELVVGAIGGRLTFLFTPTGLGCINIVKCLCGEEINLTKSEDW